MTTRGIVVTGMVAASFAVFEPSRSAAQGTSEMPEAEPDCPPALQGSTVKATPIKRGVELVFTSATSAQLPGLRAHLREVATVVEQQIQVAKASDQPDAEAIPELDIDVKNAPLGARVIVKTQRPLDVMALQDLGQGLEDAWVESSCGLGPSMRMPSSGRELEEPPVQTVRVRSNAPR